MKLTPENVSAIFKDCLYNDGEDRTNAKIVEGARYKFGFHPERLSNHDKEIDSLLDQLPEQFKESYGGGGWSFLQACETKDGELWGEHTNIEELICLGIALNKVKFCFPKEMWMALPGGMPYFVILK